LRRDRLLEEYYLWKLGSTESEERDFAAVKLVELRSVRAVPRLLSLLRGEPRARSASSEKTPGSGMVLLMREWPQELPPLCAALADIGLPAVPALLDELQRSGPRSAL